MYYHPLMPSWEQGLRGRSSMSQTGITILGTGGDSNIVGRQVRASAGLIIKTPDSQLHIDPGPGTLVQMAKHDFHPRETTCILLSHQHLNHANDASALISAMTHNGIDKRGVLITNTLDDCIIPGYFRLLTERSIALKDQQRIGINDLEIKAVGLKHYDSKALGYLINTPNYNVGYISDTEYTDGLAEQFKEANVLVICCKYPQGVKEGDHLNTDDVIMLLEKVKPQLAVITHFGAKMVHADPLAQARVIHRATKVAVIAAKDGLHISPSTYDAKKKQHTISSY
jgi:ribonuclease BN (tRNA processing enzyme)